MRPKHYTCEGKGGDYLYVGRYTSVNSMAANVRTMRSDKTAVGAGPDKGKRVELIESDHGPLYRGSPTYAQIEVYMDTRSLQHYFRSVENFAERMRVIEPDQNPHQHTFIAQGKVPFSDNMYLALLEEQIEKERRAKFSILCMAHGLGWLLREVEGCPNADNLYHNADHMIDVAIRAVEFYQTEVLLNEIIDEPMSPRTQHRDISLLIAAGLLHDWNHSGGSCPDAQNIAAAVAKVESIEERLESSTGYSGLAKHVCAVIEITEFPFVCEPDTLVEKCLRDADVTGFFTTHGSKELFERFWPEARLAGKIDADTPLALLERQYGFINNLTLYTEPGRSFLLRQKDTAFARAKLYIHESRRINSL